MALRRFGPLMALKNRLKIVSDCNALTLTLAKKDPNKHLGL